MLAAKNKKKFAELRNEFKYFSFDNYSYSVDAGNFHITFSFSLNGHYSFTPEITIPGRNFYDWEKIPKPLLENLIFHMGMVELISYWKAACPPKVIIKPYKLTEAQILWWKKLYFNGLGEFFYLNNIETDQETFMEIISESDKITTAYDFETQNTYMVPIGGGKDSVVTLELLKRRFPVVPMIINPRKATDECIEMAGYTREDSIIVYRSIHPQLLELNEQGFLNGHTPFSAMLAFTTLLLASFSGIRNIALSNEASANESTVKGLAVNHQYSKSFEFESDFRQYTTKFITPSVNYFSFLRPLHEIQIAGLFTGYKQYYSVFKSCNTGSKTDTWCCDCPKCLFAYIILAPYLNQEELRGIFGEDLMNKPSLQFAFDQLTGIEDIKPFDCIGTIEEVNVALCVVVNQEVENLPCLLKRYIKTDVYRRYKNIDLSVYKDPLEIGHFLQMAEMDIIKESLHAE